MIKKTFVLSGVLAVSMLATSVFAEVGVPGATTTVTTSSMRRDVRGHGDRESQKQRQNNASSTASVLCVGSAVAARESALGTAMSAHGQAVNAAYSARASALSAAYTKPTVSEVRTAVNAAWTTFNASTKAAQKTWRTSRTTAWTKFSTDKKACHAPEQVSDANNMGSEVNGQ